jgi:hypothetical protein
MVQDLPDANQELVIDVLRPVGPRDPEHKMLVRMLSFDRESACRWSPPVDVYFGIDPVS